MPSTCGHRRRARGTAHRPGRSSRRRRTAGRRGPPRKQVRRNVVTRQGDHRFAILLKESVLHYRIGDPDTMTAQLGHPLSAMALPAASLGVIPFTATCAGATPTPATRRTRRRSLTPPGCQ
ncbi:Scr1 family TA system antitoxin-like transcriptional regulator [Streptomyces spinosirectus]